jgi:hypothetical protein
VKTWREADTITRVRLEGDAVSILRGREADVESASRVAR